MIINPPSQLVWRLDPHSALICLYIKGAVKNGHYLRLCEWFGGYRYNPPASRRISPQLLIALVQYIAHRQDNYEHFTHVCYKLEHTNPIQQKAITSWILKQLTPS